MRTNNHILLTRMALYGLMALAILLIAFGVKSMLSARAQGTNSKTPTGAVASLGSEKTSFGAVEQVNLQVTITNPNDFSVGVLKWFTPAEGVQGPLFTVTRDGEPVAYIGIMVKRAAPTAQDYLTLGAGESLTRTVDLSAYYDLSISGNYEVRYDVSSIQLYAQEDNRQLNINDHLTSNELNMFIEGRPAPVHAPLSP